MQNLILFKTELFNTDVQSQVKAKEGLDKVKVFAKENPNFNTNNEGDIVQKIQSVNLMQTLYEASLYKVQAALANLWDTQRPSYHHANLINTTYDKQVNISNSYLKFN